MSLKGRLDLSSDENSLRNKFNDELMEADWELLKPHHNRGALFIVDGELNLVEVGIDVALDRAESVKSAMNKSLIRRPEEAELIHWDKILNNKIGKFLIVSPYVFLQIEE